MTVVAQSLVQASAVTAVSVDDLFQDSLTSDSGTDLSPGSMVFPANSEDCFPMQMGDSWTLCMQPQMKTHDGSSLLSIVDPSNDDYYFDTAAASVDGDQLLKEPKKARRQAQNRAAQRAFRERKERYIQELEEKTMIMSKNIANLESDRKRLEGALRVARAEADALKSLPSCLRTATASDRSQIACKVEGLGGRHSVVFTLEVGVQEVRLCPEEGGKPSIETET